MHEDGPVIVLYYDNDYSAVIAINSILTKSIEPCKLKTTKGSETYVFLPHTRIKTKILVLKTTLLRFKGKMARGKGFIIL